MSGSGLMAQSLEPVSDSVSPSLSLSAPPPLTVCVGVLDLRKAFLCILRVLYRLDLIPAFLFDNLDVL